MARELFANNAQTTLASSLTNVATSMTVASSSGFPNPEAGDFFRVAIGKGPKEAPTSIEVVKVTAVSGTTWTIARALEGSAAAWDSADWVMHWPTAGMMQRFEDAVITASNEAFRNFDGGVNSTIPFTREFGIGTGVADAVDTPPGTSVLRCWKFEASTGVYTGWFSGQRFQFDPDSGLYLYGWAKADDGSGGVSPALHYIGLRYHDDDGNAISSYMWQRAPGAVEAELAAPLSVGDSTITLNTTAGWYNGSNYLLRYFRLAYTSSLGRLWSPQEYSRHHAYIAPYTAAGAWSQGAISGNVITLAAPLPAALGNPAGGAWPIGTKITNAAIITGDYAYVLVGGIAISNQWQALPPVWVRGTEDPANPTSLRIPSSARSASALVFPHYGTAGRLRLVYGIRKPLRASEVVIP